MTLADPTAMVLHKDSCLLVLNKPAGLAVHAGPKTPESLENHLEALRFGNRALPQAAHRLDWGTSGCLLLGRHAKALSRLGKLFAEHRIGKTYWAIVVGAPAAPRGRIDLALLKVNNPNGWRMEPNTAGQSAITDYELLGSAQGLSWITFRPQTGRTHQIRVHAASLGCPLLGDKQYGAAAAGQMLLHARELVIPYHADRAAVHVTAPPPPAFADKLAALGFSYA